MAEKTGSAKAVVESYWRSSYEEGYALLSRDYKERLRRHFGVSNANDYRKALANPERIWGRRTYQRIKRISPNVVQVTILIAWEQEGYEGVMTFVCDVVKEGDVWRIENIVH